MKAIKLSLAGNILLLKNSMLFPFSSCTLIFELVPSASILYKAYELFVPKSLVCIMLILLTVVYKALAPDMSKCVTFPYSYSWVD
ncbi:hypothetical protein NXX23_13255 [Bacteroides ovatus]|nr:hypothetical protein [Bacteroides ovatus]